MRTGNGTKKPGTGGKSDASSSKAGTDRLHSVDGGLTQDGGISATKSFNTRSGRDADQGNDDGLRETPWFEPVVNTDKEHEYHEVMDCPDGVCPVPWATDTSGDTVSERQWDVYMGKHLALEAERKKDVVNHPEHYTSGSVECIEAIESQLTPEEYRGYLKGNVAKYLWREKQKGGKESLEKAEWYLQRLILQSL